MRAYYLILGKKNKDELDLKEKSTWIKLKQ